MRERERSEKEDVAKRAHGAHEKLVSLRRAPCRERWVEATMPSHPLPGTTIFRFRYIFHCNPPSRPLMTSSVISTGLAVAPECGSPPRLVIHVPHGRSPGKKNGCGK